MRDLIRWLWKSQCTDVRDRVYSLLSLVDQGDLTVDYSEMAVDLFWRTGEHFQLWMYPLAVSRLYLALGLTGASLNPSDRNECDQSITLPLTYLSNDAPELHQDLWHEDLPAMATNLKCLSCGGSYSTLDLDQTPGA
jgi:hypothetical protein